MDIRIFTKAFFITLGVIFLALLILGGIGINTLVDRRNRLDQESQSYANRALPAIFSAPDGRELLKRASPELMQMITLTQVSDIFHAVAALGPVRRFDQAQGQAVVTTARTNETTMAQYTAKAHFDKGDATITLVLIKHGEQWQVLGFQVNFPQLPSRSSALPIRA